MGRSGIGAAHFVLVELIVAFFSISLIPCEYHRRRILKLHKERLSC